MTGRDVYRWTRLIVASAAAAVAAIGSPASAAAAPVLERYVVVLDDGVDRPGVVAERHAERFGARLRHVFAGAPDGYAASMTRHAARAVARDPRVAAVGPDVAGRPLAQAVPRSVERAFALENPGFDFDGDGSAVDVDVAILDSGIEHGHPDLNVAGRTDCFQQACQDGTGEDVLGHGTVVGGIVAARDNSAGYVGVAPGARLWGVRIADRDIRVPPSNPDDPQPFHMSDVIAGVQWVTAHSAQIEVANMSLRFPLPTGEAEEEVADALAAAIAASVDAGVVYVVAAANEADDAAASIPANHPDVITVSGIADFDGRPGGLAGAAPCALNYPGHAGEEDDTLAQFSNHGSAVEVAAPAICAHTTGLGGSYTPVQGQGWGTSMAAPHVAGAAAILASVSNPGSRADVMRIRDTIVAKGSYDWHDDSGDGFKEPLLDMGCAAFFTPKLVGSAAPVKNRKAESDVDCDGRSDLVTLRPSGVARVHAGGADGRFDGVGESSFSDGQGGGTLDPALYDGSGHHVVDVSDVTGDGRADLVTVSSDGSAQVHPAGRDKRFGAGVESLDGLIDPALLQPGGHEPIAVADVDDDGRGDLVCYDDRADDVIVYPGNVDGTFDPGVAAQTDVQSALHDDSGRYFVDVADVTGDGNADLVSINSWNDLYVSPGRDDATFEAPVPSQAGAVAPAMDDGKGFEPVGLGDVNGDGRADLVLHKDGTSYVFRGQASGSFLNPIASFGGAVPSTTFGGEGFEIVGVMDVNGDRYGDLVSGHTNGVVYVALGQGNGVFASAQTSFDDGSLESTQYLRNQDSSGSQLVMEKPSWRRRGCAPMGCRPKGDSVGVWRRQSSTWFLRDWKLMTPNFASLSYGTPTAPESDLPVAGDWDGDGDDTIGVWRRQGTYAEYRLRDSNTAGAPDRTLVWGIDEAPESDLPVVGDWDGDGDDTLGVWRRGGQYGTFILRNSNTAGGPSWDDIVTWGIDEAPENDLPVVGDWDGDGDDTVGVWRRQTNTWYLCNVHTACGTNHVSFQYGSSATYDDLPVVGDWDGDGDDTVGVWRRQGSGASFLLRNSHSPGPPDYTVWWGADETPYDDLPVIGNWFPEP